MQGDRWSVLGDRRVQWTLALLIVVVLTLSGAVDRGAIASNDRVFGRALLTLGAARALDAAISLAQGTEIAMQPAGVGLTVSAGEILDPVNDLLEQFSSLMLVATTSLGLQGLLLRASTWWVLSGLLVVASALRATGLWWPHGALERWQVPLGRTVVLLFAIRFALPLFAYGSGMIFDQFLEPSRAEAVGMLEDTTDDLAEMDRLDEAPPDDGEATWLGRVSNWFAETVEMLDVEQRLVAFRDRVGEIAEQVVYLLVVFALQTIVMPLAFLWLAPRLVGLALDRVRRIA